MDVSSCQAFWLGPCFEFWNNGPQVRARQEGVAGVVAPKSADVLPTLQGRHLDGAERSLACSAQSSEPPQHYTRGTLGATAFPVQGCRGDHARECRVWLRGFVIKCHWRETTHLWFVKASIARCCNITVLLTVLNMVADSLSYIAMWNTRHCRHVQALKAKLDLSRYHIKGSGGSCFTFKSFILCLGVHVLHQ